MVRAITLLRPSVQIFAAAFPASMGVAQSDVSGAVFYLGTGLEPRHFEWAEGFANKGQGAS